MKLYNNIGIVHGSNRTLYIDFQTSKYCFIKNIDFFATSGKQQKNVQKILHNKGFFMQKDSFFTEENFPKIDLTNYHTHYFNGIIDFSNNTIQIIDKIINLITHINCNSLQLRFTDNIEKNKIKNILNEIDQLEYLENCEIVINPDKYPINIFNFYKNIPIYFVTFYNCNSKTILIPHKTIDYNPFFSLKLFFKFYFNQIFFIETQTVNPYFFNKFYIDSAGQVYNTPETKKNIVSNIFTETVEQVELALKSYLKNSLNIIPKNIITICKDCELRYSCMDNRLVIQTNNQFVYNEYCPYNPYISKWEGEEGFITVTEYFMNNYA